MTRNHIRIIVAFVSFCESLRAFTIASAIDEVGGWRAAPQ